MSRRGRKFFGSAALGGVSNNIFVPDSNPLGLVAVNDRHFVPGSANNNINAINTTQGLIIRAAPSDSAINDLQFMDCGYVQLNVVGESPNLYGYTITRTIESAGTRYGVTWDGGAASKYIPPGITNYYSDKLTLPADIAAGATYKERTWKLWDYKKPVATIIVSGGAITGFNITDGGKNINLGTSPALLFSIAGGSGKNITLNFVNGVMVAPTIVSGGTGYTNGSSVSFTQGFLYYQDGNNGNSTYGDRLTNGNDLPDLTVAGDPVGTTMTYLVAATSVSARRITAGKVVGVLGTSITYGLGDTIDANGRLGLVERSLAGAKGSFILSRQGETLSYYFTAGSGRKKALLRPGAITHLIFEMLTNDIFFLLAYTTLAQVQAAVRSALAPYIAAGIKVFPCTTLPVTTGTFTSAAGQAQYSASSRALANSVNAWMLTPGVATTEGWTGVIDLDGTLRDPASTDVFRSDGGNARTGDGVHPNAQGVADIIAAGICGPGIFV